MISINQLVGALEGLENKGAKGKARGQREGPGQGGKAGEKEGEPAKEAMPSCLLTKMCPYFSKEEERVAVSTPAEKVSDVGETLKTATAK